MPYVLQGVDDELLEVNASDLEQLRREVMELRVASQREERHRRYATYATIAGAVFAAARLGIIWFPFIRRARRRRR